MEKNVEKKKLGAGIIVLSVFFILGQVLTIISSLPAIINLDEFNNALVSLGESKLTMGQVVFSVILTVIMLVSLILILLKKSIGVYIFIGIQVVSIIYSIITTGLSIRILTNLLLPGLFLFFIYKKKDIYFKK